MKESQEEKRQKMLAGIHCCLCPPLQLLLLLSLLCCCCCATAVVVAIDQHGGARGQVTDKSKLWSITEHSLLQVSGVFLTSNVFDESRFAWRCFGEMPRATDKSSAPCTQVEAELEMPMEPEPEPNTELTLKPQTK